MSEIPETMKAVGFDRNLPIEDADSLLDFEQPVPVPGPRDLLVEVRAVSVNPVDVKVRANRPQEGRRVLGFDASGVVVAVGEDAELFEVGDEVYYAGSIDRPGSNSEYQLVDERIVGQKPKSLDFPQAAAMPLTSITAWESLFDRFRLDPDSEGVLLILGAAGGVGSVMIQLAKELTDVTVIGTASREESRNWVKELGADHVLDHSGDLVAQVKELVPDGVNYIFSPYTKGQIESFVEMSAPFGQITAIDDPGDLDVMALKSKSLTFHWELMFTRPMFGTPDMIQQHNLLNEVGFMIDDGEIRTTVNKVLTPIDAATLKEAHALVESGKAVGKVVLSRP